MSSTKQEVFNKHNCDSNGEDKTKQRMEQKNDGKMIKDLAHYLTSSYTKGSKEEIGELIAKLEEPDIKKVNNIKNKILNQRYIIYDFETDTHTDSHKCNHVEVDVLKVDEELTHEYDNCLIKSFGING